jgi:hypothetical protein
LFKAGARAAVSTSLRSATIVTFVVTTHPCGAVTQRFGIERVGAV